MKQSAESSSHSQTSFTLLSFPFSALCAIKAPTQQTHKCRVVFPVWWRISAPLSSCVTLTTFAGLGAIPALLSASQAGAIGYFRKFRSVLPSLTTFFIALCDSNWAGGGTRVGESGGAFPNCWDFTSVGSTLLAGGILEFS